MARAERPEWAKRLVAYSYKSAHVHHKLERSRDASSFQHRQLMQSLSPTHAFDVENLLDVCDRIVLGSVAAPISPEEWDQIIAWHHHTSRLLTALPHITDQICEPCQATIAASGILDYMEDEDLTDAVSTLFDLIDRVSRQGAAQRRRFLRILQDAKENGTTTTFQVSRDGVVTAEHGGMTAGYTGKDAG